ncbi:MAG TPA: MBL fold metallo-hydrolase [Bryobacteraceae bacterium]|nr:MBL fold metallo-hydrolase [Bryobacteraceae bacterium]
MKGAAIGLALAVAAAPWGCAQGRLNLDKTEFEVLPVQGNVYMLASAAGNVTVQVGKNGVLVVDTSYPEMTGKILAAVQKLSDKPVRYIINTHVHRDHTGGNENFARTFGSATAVSVVNTPGSTATQTVQIYAHDNVLARMTKADGGLPAAPSIAWPTETFTGDEKELYFNGEAVLMYHEPAAHTDGDTIVYFRASDVISAGDLIVTTGYPVIDLQRGGSLQGIINGLNHVLEIAVPAHHEEGGTYVIPGHGRIYDEFDVVEYRDMLTIIRDRIQALIKKGATLEQVMAARPTRDYDPQYGSATGPWTTERFVEAAYRSLK